MEAKLAKTVPKHSVVNVIVQHWHTKGTRIATLKRVKESDCCWRFPEDRAELSYDWAVVEILARWSPPLKRFR